MVEAEQPVDLTLTLPDGIDEIDAVLHVERATFDDAGEVSGFDSYGEVLPIRYRGPAVDSLTLTIQAPAATGAYRISLVASDDEAQLGSDELFVQEPA